MRKVFTLFILVLISSCGGGGGSSTEQAPSKSNQSISFEITGSINKLVTDVKFTITASGGSGTGEISYLSSAESIASVNSSTGEITIIAAGSTTITAKKATDANYNAASTTYTLNIEKVTQSIAFTQLGPIQVFVNDSYINPISGENDSISYYSSDISIATVDDDGKVTLLGTGEVFITAIKAESEIYQSAEQSYLLQVAPHNIQVNALVGSTDSQLSFPVETHGLTILRTTDENCNLDDIYSCDEGQSDAISEFSLTDTALTTNNAAFYSVKHGNIKSTAKMVSTEEMGSHFLHQAVEFNGKIWLIGGNDSEVRTNKVMYSVDGDNWQVATEDAAFSGRHYAQVVVYQDKIWLIGGADENGQLNDIWSSSDGENWQLETADAAFSKRIGHQVVVFNNKLWLTGGWVFSSVENKNEVWSSSDGINWTLVTDNADFSPRLRHQSVVFNNKIWIIGGQEENGHTSDVWYSEDGEKWLLATDNWGELERRKHEVVVFDNKIWIIGGYTYTFDNTGSITTRHNDVWSSTDGVNWLKVNAEASFTGRRSHELIAFNNKLWLLGGYDDNSASGDVWSTTDGIDWSLHTANPQFSPRTGHSSVIFDDKFWHIGGLLGVDSTDEVWSSEDGFNWSLASDEPGFKARQGHQSVVFKDKVWVFGGTSSKDYQSEQVFDIWSSSDGINWSLAKDLSESFNNPPQVALFENKLWLYGKYYDSGQNLTKILITTDGIEWEMLSNNIPAEVGISHLTSFKNKLWSYYTEYDQGDYKVYVWSSVDGINWELENDNMPFATESFEITTYDEKLWLTGGSRLSDSKIDLVFSNDVWMSTDGIEWQLMTSDAEFPARSGHQVTVFKDKLWLNAGSDTSTSLLNDNWVSENGIDWRKVQRFTLSFD